MDSYKKCPLKKRPINYELDVFTVEPENLSTEPQDLSMKRKSSDEIEYGETKRQRHTSFSSEPDHYNNPVNWSTSFAHSEIDHRSMSPSTDSCASVEYYRETSVSPPAIHPSYHNIHLRGLTRQQHLEAEARLVPRHEAPLYYRQQDPNEPQDLSMKSCIPLPALYYDFGSEQPIPQEKPKQHPRFNCHNCGKSYTTFSGLSKHQEFHCPAAECNQVKRFFNCEHCDKSYTTSGALKMHIRTHTLPCKCPTCGKAFSRPWLLQGHIRTHTGEKPFKCQYCARAFADRSNLRAHLQTHAEVKKYICNTCNKSFSRMSLLTKHNEGGCLPTNAPTGHMSSMMVAPGAVYAV